MERPNAGSPGPPSCWCFGWLALLLVIIFFSFIIALIVITFTTSFPDDPKFQISSASFTLLGDVIGPNLTAKFDITFTVINPNKKYNISYKAITATLYYSGCEYYRLSKYDYCTILASTHIPPFLQLNESENKLPVQINVVNEFVGDYMDGMAQGSIEVSFKFDVRFRTMGNKSRTQVALQEQEISMQFYCERLRFVFMSDNATFASGSCLSHPFIIFY